ncbi:MAG TPA: phosphoribosylaminoimidazolesuccinocarboxamide synthase [Acidobacteriota bacterium]|nr:phosphoribosylaminoimidazolesuccinocarboxamide synthase [Acidobacteriota bacterium]
MRTLELPGIPKVNRGKVREIFQVDDNHLLIVVTDRISAFDVVLPNTIPHKGKVLNQLSAFWFEQVEHIVPNHVVSTRVEDFPARLKPFRDDLKGRSMLVRKCRPLAVECVVRGYLAGSGWKEYRETGEICGIRLPPGLQEADELPEPIFTPSTKAVTGHDQNITFEQVIELLGSETANAVRDFSLSIYRWARQYARERGIIICDTKFEFGYEDSRLLLIDEVLTPDSSRFWPADEYKPGRPQPSFDKQFIRDYLETLDWDKTPPGPELPEDIVAVSSRRYIEAYRRLTGNELEL